MLIRAKQSGYLLSVVRAGQMMLERSRLRGDRAQRIYRLLHSADLLVRRRPDRHSRHRPPGRGADPHLAPRAVAEGLASAARVTISSWIGLTKKFWDADQPLCIGDGADVLSDGSGESSTTEGGM